MSNSTVSKPQPVLVALSVLATLDALHVGLDAGNVLPENVSTVIGALLAAVNIGVAFYLRGIVTPFSNVVAYQPNTDDPTRILAGGATTIEGKVLPDNPVELGRLTK